MMNALTATFLILAMLPGTIVTAQELPSEFLVFSDEAGFTPPAIVVQFDPRGGTGVDWKLAQGRPWHDSSEAAQLGAAVEFLREGIHRLCGQRLDVVNSNDLSRGIVLTLLNGASDDIREDDDIREALKNDGRDSYNHREAFFIRSEPERLLIVANRVEGLLVAAPELLESVGYEVLGMGPNWVHVPADCRKRLAFRIQRKGRPGYYLRGLHATSGQSYGVGTIMKRELLVDPDDETVDVSYRRWQVGRRLRTRSMPSFPGHAMQAYHRAVVEQMRTTGTADGFLATVKLGLNADRPSASEANQGWLWINTDAANQAGHGQVFYSRKSEWKAGDLRSLPMNLDLSVPAIRAIVLDALKSRSETFFGKNPDDTFVFGTDPEDGGGYADLANRVKFPNWYPEYLSKTASPFGRPYVLHKFKGLDQPRELWDAAAPSDHVYGFNNWLLQEFDRWIDSLPADQQITSSGRSKKAAIRCSFYCYNYHDVPPNFNLDPRIRVMIAGYPKHRGRGKWNAFASQTDLAQAFRLMLPREPSGDYWIISLSYFRDRNLDGLKSTWDGSPESLTTRQQEHFAAGFRALSVETDFNFGRMGLGYYLLSQVLWNPRLSADDLDAIRGRWLKRAFGSGWQPMKDYYDFMLPKNYPVNSPHAWSRAIRFIDAADKLIDPATEPDAMRRLDDLKQYWYFYYLVATGQDKPTSQAMQELAWKGQMSYMNASHMIMRRIFNTNQAELAAGEYMHGPAHFTPAETDQWWPKILKQWPIVPVDRFADVKLADRRFGRDVDLNDLVAVTEFGNDPCRQAFLYNSGYMTPPAILTTASRADEEIGLQLYWPADVTGKDRYYIARDVPYGISRWNERRQRWDELVDKTMTAQPSDEVRIPGTNRERHHLAAIRFKAPSPGTYRFEIGRGGNLSYLTDLGWKSTDNQHTAGRSLTFDGNVVGLTQSSTWIYIPKGTPSLDLEVWDSNNRKFVTLYKSLPPGRKNVSRKVDVSQRKTHRIKLSPDETGTLAEISGNGFAFPYLYSVPMLWAKSPGQLLIPRAVAAADKLTPRVAAATVPHSGTPIVKVKKEVYVKQTVANKAPWVYVFPGNDGYREEIHTVWSHANQVKGYGDSPSEPRRRTSLDNGKTWSKLTRLPPFMTYLDKATVLDWKFCGIYDPLSKRHVSLAIHHVRDMRQGSPRMIYNHALVRTSADGGQSFGAAQLLKYEAGDDLNADDVMKPKFLESNTAYPGQSILRHSNGSLLIPVTNTRIPSHVEDEVIGRTRWPEKGTIGSLCFVGRWNDDAEKYSWTSGRPVWLPRTTAFNGLLEADVAELNDGRVLMVFRVTINKDQPAYKWFSVSNDAGMTFSKPRVFRYSDGSHFFSGSNFHRLFRSGKTRKLYWIGNLVEKKPTNPGHPRYPLVIAEVDETTLGLKKETVTEIDTRQAGEGERLQLSNFWILENRDTLDLEIYLTRLNEDPEETFAADAYKYTLSFEK